MFSPSSQRHHRTRTNEVQVVAAGGNRSATIATLWQGRLAAMIDAFVKKYPEGYFTALAQALVPSGDVGTRPLPTTAAAPRQP